MANPEHVAKLKEGAGAWNEWRRENPEIEPDLSRTNLKGMAILSGCDLSHVKLDRANLQGAFLIHTDLGYADLSYADLSNAQLSQANLQSANLNYADLNSADFRLANLRLANLSNAQIIKTNFYGANLTGACITGWAIDDKTNFQNVRCNAIHLAWDESQNRPTNRRPQNPNEVFAPGDFIRLITQTRDTVDLIFREGIRWNAFATSLQQINTEQFITQDEEQTLSVKAIESEDDGSLVIRLRTPSGVDKAAIEADFKTQYESELKRLEAQLQLKDEQIAFYKERNTDMTDIVKMLANRSITNTNIVEATTMSDSVEQNIQTAYGVVGINKGSVKVNQPQQSLSEAAAEIQALLTQLEQTNPTTSTMEQMQVAMKAVEQIENDATLKEKVISAAKGGALAGLKTNPIGKIIVGVIEGWTEA